MPEKRELHEEILELAYRKRKRKYLERMLTALQISVDIVNLELKNTLPNFTHLCHSRIMNGFGEIWEGSIFS